MDNNGKHETNCYIQGELSRKNLLVSNKTDLKFKKILEGIYADFTFYSNETWTIGKAEKVKNRWLWNVYYNWMLKIMWIDKWNDKVWCVLVNLVMEKVKPVKENKYLNI